MTTGPEHYQQGGQLLDAALHGREGLPAHLANVDAATLIAAAHAHFAAALVAATALCLPPVTPYRDHEAWTAAAGTPVRPAASPEEAHPR
jgi:hypothetical protein